MKKRTNDQVPRCDLIEAWNSFFPPQPSCPIFLIFFLLFGELGEGGKKEYGKVKSLDWQALAFRLRRVRMIQYQVSHQTDKDKKISKSAPSFL
ncbi:hypothetical protein V8C35DRAFT_315682 [Trichoderma chlorosporum]